MSIKEVLFIMVAVGGTSLAFAQDPAMNIVADTVSSSTKTETSSQAPAPTALLPESVSMTDSGLVSLDFRDADIQNVLKILALKSGVNIVTSPTVTGVVTIQLKDVPWEQALDVVVRTYGFALERRENIILVMTIEEMKKRREDTAILAEQEQLDTKTFTLSFGKAEQVVASIEKIKSERGAVNFDARTNTIIVTETPSRLKLVTEVVQKLDSVTPQVLIEAKMIKKTFSDIDNIGTSWTTSISAGGARRAITWPFAQSSENKFLGNPFQGVGASNFSYGTLNASQVQAAFELLRTQTDTEVLSSPRVVTIDNKMAKVVVGTDYPIPNYTYNEQTGELDINGFEWKEIGVAFEVTPHVNNPGLVTLDVKPSVTSYDPTASLSFQGAVLPLISKEEAVTSVMIKHGETLVIAGLISDTISKSKRRVPGIGDVPLFGWFFRKKETSNNKTDLLVFITPHILMENPSDLSALAAVNNVPVVPTPTE